MDIWYSILSILPFEWATYGEMNFIKNALLAVIIVGPLFGIAGIMIVNNKMAFFSDALGHGAFTGIVVGAMAGFFNTKLSAVVFSVVFAIAITFVKQRTRMSGDTVIGVFSSITIALGIFFGTLGGSAFTKLNKYLIGDLLSISPSEILSLFIVLIITLIVWVFILNRLLVISISNSLALSRGFNVLWIECVFASFVAVIVTLSMSFVGLLVINSFLVLPAATARHISNNIRQYHLISIAISVFSGVSGLIISYYSGTAAGATIVLVAAVIFMGVFIFRRKLA